MHSYSEQNKFHVGPLGIAATDKDLAPNVLSDKKELKEHAWTMSAVDVMKCRMHNAII